MLNNVQLYYFSPTGGTKSCGDIFCRAIANSCTATELTAENILQAPDAELTVFALPVYSGRIPAIAAEKIAALKGSGKKAVTMVVYGVRAYEDALLELNNTVSACGFDIVASAAVVARHSIVPAVGQGRPDKDDEISIAAFAEKVLEKLENSGEAQVSVPGNFPYKEVAKSAATPVCTAECIQCGSCVSVCPTGAIKLEAEGIKTDGEACILCMACVYACPAKARVLPAPVQQAMDEKLGGLISIRRENEYFL